MTDNKNTIFGWILFSGIVALGLSILSGKFFHADHPEMPEKPGLVIEAAEEGSGAAAEMSMAQAISMMSVDEQMSAGEAVFQKCVACHTINQGGANGQGPNLYGVMGSTIGKHAPGFAYSSALVEKGGVWDWDAMNAWLKNPKAFVSGTKMAFAGLSKIEDRAALTVYLNSFGSNLPLPEYVEAVAEESEEGEVAEAPAADGEEAAAAEPEATAAAE